VFGDVTTGAESDIQQVTRIARGMVERWGMSEKVGFLTVAPQDGQSPLLPGAEPVSEATQELIDAEVRRIVDEEYDATERLLGDNRERLWQGQANDAYWHGVFGGCYLPHLRRVLLGGPLGRAGIQPVDDDRSDAAEDTNDEERSRRLESDAEGVPELQVRIDPSLLAAPVDAEMLQEWRVI